MDLLLEVIRPVALLALGVYTGGTLFTSPAFAPGLSRLPGPAYVSWWQAMNVDLGRRMPPLLLGLSGSLLVVAMLSVGNGAAVLSTAALSAALVMASVALTVARMERLNRIGDTWTLPDLPADWAAVREHWTRLHVIRTAMACSAFVSLVLSQALSGR